MYISISEDGQPFYSEGFVVRFYKSDKTEWVANFKPGWTEFSLVIDYPESNLVLVIAKGQAYIMTPDEFKPIDTFGVDIVNAIKMENNKVVVIDSVCVRLVDDKGTIWKSERISWDGIKDLKLHDKLLTGLSYDPRNTINEWVPFSINMETKEIIGGSYRS